jgi:hypothetical protein
MFKKLKEEWKKNDPNGNYNDIFILILIMWGLAIMFIYGMFYEFPNL